MAMFYRTGFDRLRRARFVFVVPVSIYRRTSAGQDAAGAMVQDWETVATDWNGFVSPMAEDEVLAAAEMGQSANYFVHLWRDDAGNVPDVRPDYRLTFPDRRGETHTVVARYAVDEALAGAALRVACDELTEG